MIPDDIKAIFVPVVEHRLALSTDALVTGVDLLDVLSDILRSSRCPRATRQLDDLGARRAHDPRGWGLLAGGAAMIVAAYLVGLPELYAVGAAALVLVASARVWEQYVL